MVKSSADRNLVEKARCVIWKLDRNELDSDGRDVPAKIDRNDLVIRQLRDALELVLRETL